MEFGHSGPLELPEIGVIYDRFSALHELFPDPRGSLLLHSGLDPAGVALSMASNVAGAASLCIEPEVSLAKQALRGGVCDFLVNELDEALRILKNEIRKSQSVSVALTGEPELVLTEAVDRGLQPEMVSLPFEGAASAAAATLIARGARPLPAEWEADDGMIAVQWSVAREPLRWLPLADARAANALDPRGPTTVQRQRWIELSPRYLGRPFAAQRFLAMTPAEADTFVAAVQRDVLGGEIQVAVSVVRNGEENLVLS